MNTKLLLLSLLSGILLCGTMQATTYFVNRNGNGLGTSAEDACTIKKALEWARPSDVICIVEEGKYALPDSGTFHIIENLTIIGKESVSLVAGKGQRTVLIHGERAEVPVTVRLENLIIEGGIANVADTVYFGTVTLPVETGKGGGIYNRFAQTTLKNVIVRGNIATTAEDIDGFGGGVYNAENSSLTLEGGRIQDNVASKGLQAGFGGGIYNAGQLRITDTPDSVVISGNRAVANKLSAGEGAGGGLMSAQSGSVVMSGKLVVLNNIATIGTGIGKGGGIAITSNTLFDIEGRGITDDEMPEGYRIVLSVRENVAIGNSDSKADGSGGGIYVNEDEGAGLADLRINTKYAGQVEIIGNSATAGLGKGFGGGISVGVNGRVIFDGQVSIMGNYAIKNSKNSAAGNGGGVYRASEVGTTIRSGNDPLIKDNIVTTGKGSVVQSPGMWTFTVNLGKGFVNAPNTEVYDVLLPSFHLALTMAEGYHVTTPRLCKDTFSYQNDYTSYHKENNTYYYNIERVSNLELYARTAARKITFVSNSPGLTFLSGGVGDVMIDTGRDLILSVQKTAEKYKGGDIRRVFYSFVDAEGVRQQKELEPTDPVGDGFTLNYSVSPLVCDTIWAEFDACRIVLDPAPEGEGFSYREHSQIWKEGAEDVTYLASGKEFMLKIASHSLSDSHAPQVFVNGQKIQPRSRNSAENTSTYYVVPEDEDSILIESSIYTQIVYMEPLPEGLQFIPFGKDFHVMESGFHKVSGDFNVSVKIIGSEMRNVLLLAEGAESAFLGKNYEKKEYYFSVSIPKRSKDTVFLHFDYEALNVVYFDPDNMYGIPAVDGELLDGIRTYSLCKGDTLRFTIATNDLIPSVSAVNTRDTIILPPLLFGQNTGIYTYEFPFTGEITGIDTFFIHSTKKPHLSLTLVLPQGVKLVETSGVEVTNNGYKINVTGEECTISILTGAYYKLAQPVIHFQGGEEYPERGKDTVTFVLRNLTEDTEAVVDFLYHRISFSITDPDIIVEPTISAIAIAPNTNFEFFVQLQEQAPAVIVNGKAVIAAIEGDGRYKITLPNVSEDLEISIHKTALTISFNITDPDIVITPAVSSFAIAPNYDFEFFVELKNYTPLIVVNGKTITPEIEGDGKYRITLPNISENLEISIRKPSLAVIPSFHQDVKVTLIESVLKVESPTPIQVTVYTLTGHVKVQVQINGEANIPLSSGVYVVKVGTKTYKAVCQ
ncbi:MAG: T9SS type A sorting domain-containing protein [Tannerellaceae bacterium]|jgi:hypothetical protein|nr:T9SS type A sorting domain-containing protein [Tannerellaceae bacterium]